ncbi:PREDICTED: embryonic polarity protein dorsal-like isoform X1 [Papilio xuthus]|uniref:Embryonic polarity protein dorsal-like isoform X1 n=2 Tax=Papilio xuthus TaxID=66420 RepID=A0AAJ6ZNU7_PAPXU|nr:PREDICTED: embryonic polarity protein dorsal-like isoform X1 [Papilio xuthus]XP_013176409.1 PREDICTED: embryonic polarity protein dorsal-like isoform X1 [Papilio xuthus]
MANQLSISRRTALQTSELKKRSKKPSVRVIVQPVDSHRFRYKSEGRWAGSIPGVNKKGNKEGYPTIEISGCPDGKAAILVSCVTKDSPYKTHPHGVVAREMYLSEEEVRKGACKVVVELTGESTKVSFNNIGIHSCKQNEVKEVLETRRSLGVDPFGSGFDYCREPKSIDLNALRLCFQVFVMDKKDNIRLRLPPVVTNVIHDKKTQGELQIVRLSCQESPATGGRFVILLCKKVKPSDTTVVFVQGSEDWEVAASDISSHQHVAFCFNTPPYRHTDITTNVTVSVQLKRLSDNARSEPVQFVYTPPRTVDKKKYTEKKPLSAWLQNANLPMESESSPEQVRYTPAQSPMEQEQFPTETKHLQPWPVDLPPMVGPSPHQLQYPVHDMSWMDRSYVQLEQLPHVPRLQTTPHAAHCDYSITSRDPSLSPARNLNPFFSHYEENVLIMDNRSECHSVSPIFAPSPDLNTGQGEVEEMQVSLEKFSGLLEEPISDHLNELSIKDFVGGDSPKI